MHIGTLLRKMLSNANSEKSTTHYYDFIHNPRLRAAYSKPDLKTNFLAT